VERAVNGVRPGQLGWLVPKVLLLFFLADLVLRFLPIDSLTFRGWEAMGRFPTGEGPFEPNKRYHKDRIFGDLSNIANVPALREYRSETFTTDALGFRNPPDLCDSGPPAALLFGSSFSAGAGLSDEQTLSAQLSKRARRTVYNASGIDADLELIRHLARRLKMSGGLVICEHLERYDLPLVPGPGAPGAPTGGPGQMLKVSGLKGWLKSVGLFYSLQRLRRWLRVSPLEILALRACRAVRDDVLLPNVAAQTIVVSRLRNGDTMIFPKQVLVGAPPVRSPDYGAAYWSWLAAELKKDNLTLMVLLVPEKTTVYRPLLRETVSLAPDGAPFLESLERAISAKGVPVVNLTPAFRRRAAAELARGNCIYWRDDTHWNPRGIAAAVAEIGRAFPPSQWQKSQRRR
jgi:hypothetical protein